MISTGLKSNMRSKRRTSKSGSNSRNKSEDKKIVASMRAEEQIKKREILKEANLRMFKDQLRVEYYRKLKKKQIAMANGQPVHSSSDSDNDSGNLMMLRMQ